MEIFDYDHVLLLPRKCRVESRSECDTSVQFGPRSFKLPAVPARVVTAWLATSIWRMVLLLLSATNSRPWV